MTSRRARPEGSRRQLRIIGGKWRSRRISFPDLPGLRPTGDRIRETLFNWLAPHIAGSHCVDAFAGSGALGFEALSRGAAKVTFVDSAPAACAALTENCRTLDARDGHVVAESFFKWLTTAPAGTVDIAFIDPPFDARLQARALEALIDSGALSSHALVYVESSAGESFRLTGWQVAREKVSGTVRYQLLSPGA